MRHLFIIFSLLVSLSVQAQEPVDTIAQEQTGKLGLVRRIVRGFDRLDEDYIEPNHYVFTVMLQATRTYERYSLSSVGDDAQSVSFSPDGRLRVGPYLGWKWIFLGYTFELNNVSLENLKQEIDLSIYSSQIGVDLFYRRTGNDYKLRSAYLGKDVRSELLDNVPFDGLQAGITGFNIYYIFNHGKFSYPAAFAQSTQQKISCGSWMAGIGYSHNTIDLDSEYLQKLVYENLGKQTVRLDSGLMFNHVKYDDFSISVGYGYNWVFARNCLLGISLQGALGYNKSVGDVFVDERKGFSFGNFNVDGIARLGLVYNNGKWYAGSSAVFHTYNYRKSRFSANNTFGSLNFYVGLNFGLKKKYKKQNNEDN